VRISELHANENQEGSRRARRATQGRKTKIRKDAQG